MKVSNRMYMILLAAMTGAVIMLAAVLANRPGSDRKGISESTVDSQTAGVQASRQATETPKNEVVAADSATAVATDTGGETSGGERLTETEPKPFITHTERLRARIANMTPEEEEKYVSSHFAGRPYGEGEVKFYRTVTAEGLQAWSEVAQPYSEQLAQLRRRISRYNDKEAARESAQLYRDMWKEIRKAIGEEAYRAYREWQPYAVTDETPLPDD